MLSHMKQLVDMVSKGQTQSRAQKRKIEALNDEVAVLKEREALLAKKLHGAYSFRARYDSLKTHTEAAVGEEKYKKIYEKVHAQANDVHKKFTAKHEADGKAHEARLQEIQSLCTTDVEKIKKEGAAQLSTLANFAVLADGSGGAEAGGKKGKKPVAANGEPPKKKKATGPTAYSKFIGDKSVRAAFNAAKEAKETELEWFAWASAEWKTYSAEQKQPYQDQADAAKAEAKAAEANGEANGEASSSEPLKKKKAVTASPIAAPAGSAKKKEQPIKEALKRLQKGSAAPNGKAPARKKAAVDSDEDEPTPKQKAKGFVLDEASEGEEDDNGEEDEEDGEMKGFIVPDGEEGEEGEEEDDDEDEVAPADGSDDDDEP